MLKALNQWLKLLTQSQIVTTLAVHCQCDVCSDHGWHSGGCRSPGSAYSIMPKWWHLMVLQYVAASFHLPSVTTANINTVQGPKPYKQFEMPTIPALVMSEVLLPQSNFMAAFVNSHSSLLFDVSSGLPTYKDHNVTQLTGLFSMVISCWTFKTLLKMSNCQHTCTTVDLVLLMSTDHITCICQIQGKNYHKI